MKPQTKKYYTALSILFSMSLQVQMALPTHRSRFLSSCSLLQNIQWNLQNHYNQHHLITSVYHLHYELHDILCNKFIVGILQKFITIFIRSTYLDTIFQKLNMIFFGSVLWLNFIIQCSKMFRKRFKKISKYCKLNLQPLLPNFCNLTNIHLLLAVTTNIAFCETVAKVPSIGN